jgi:tetratricopeptide (TPR) repeat protein
MSRPLIGLMALSLVLILSAAPASAQSNLANCKYYTKTQQDFEQGLKYCESCIYDEPENPEARYFGAWCLAEMGRWEDAWTSFAWLIDRSKSKDKKIRKHAKWAKTRVQSYFVEHFNRGVEALNNANISEASREFAVATKINPRKPEGFLNYGYTLNELGNQEGAIDAFRAAIAIDPTQAVGYDYLSVALGNRRKDLLALDEPDSMAVSEITKEYKATLEKVLEFNPESDAALLQLGDLALADGKTEEGLELLLRSIRIAPDNIANLYNVGVGFYEREDFANSAKVFGLVTQELDDPADDMWRDAMFNLGLSQLELEDWESCAATMEQLVAVNPEEADYYRILARAYNGAGDTQKASDNLMKYDEMLQAQGG